MEKKIDEILKDIDFETALHERVMFGEFNFAIENLVMKIYRRGVKDGMRIILENKDKWKEQEKEEN